MTDKTINLTQYYYTKNAADAQFATIDHGHGTLTTDGKIGNSKNKIITTGDDGVLQASNTLPTTIDIPSSQIQDNNESLSNILSELDNSLENHTHNEIIEEVSSMIPSPNSVASNSKGLGTQSAGVSNDYARADHVHPKPTLTLRQTLTKSGATVKVYEDGLNVYVTFSGTVTNIGSRAEINVGTISTAAYRPANDQYGVIAGSPGYIKCYGYISDAGTILIGHTDDTTASRYLHGYLIYPLKSRLP